MVTQSTHVSPATVPHTEAVFSIVRRIYGREHDDFVGDLDVNIATWSIFLNATLGAAVHLGQDCEANLRPVKNHLWDSVQWTNTIDTPKPTSSPTLYSVWEKWEMILWQPGRAKFKGIRKTITSRIWIESTACRRSSSGKSSQESQRWASSRRFKV